MNNQPEIQINLIKYKLEQKISQRSIFLEWCLYIFAGLLIIGLIFLYNHGLRNQIETLNKENASLQAELQRKTAQASSQQTTQKIKAAINNRSKMVATMQKKQTDYVPVLNELGQYNSPCILLSEIDVQSGIIKIKGYASSYSNLIDLLHTLQVSDYLGELTHLQMDTDGETREIYFSLQICLEES